MNKNLIIVSLKNTKGVKNYLMVSVKTLHEIEISELKKSYSKVEGGKYDKRLLFSDIFHSGCLLCMC